MVGQDATVVSIVNCASQPASQPASLPVGSVTSVIDDLIAEGLIEEDVAVELVGPDPPAVVETQESGEQAS